MTESVFVMAASRLVRRCCGRVLFAGAGKANGQCDQTGRNRSPPGHTTYGTGPGTEPQNHRGGHKNKNNTFRAPGVLFLPRFFFLQKSDKTTYIHSLDTHHRAHPTARPHRSVQDPRSTHVPRPDSTGPDPAHTTWPTNDPATMHRSNDPAPERPRSPDPRVPTDRPATWGAGQT